MQQKVTKFDCPKYQTATFTRYATTNRHLLLTFYYFYNLEINSMTGNEVIPIQCDIRDAVAVTAAVDACVDKVFFSFN